MVGEPELLSQVPANISPFVVPLCEQRVTAHVSKSTVVFALKAFYSLAHFVNIPAFLILYWIFTCPPLELLNRWTELHAIPFDFFSLHPNYFWEAGTLLSLHDIAGGTGIFCPHMAFEFYCVSFWRFALIPPPESQKFTVWRYRNIRGGFGVDVCGLGGAHSL